MFFMVLVFQNCSSSFETAINPIASSSEVRNGITRLRQSSVIGQVPDDRDLTVGPQVTLMAILPTSPMARENFDPERFKMLLQELKGRSNVINISYLSEEVISFARNIKGIMCNMSALNLLEAKLAIAEQLGFAISIEISSAFFEVNPFKEIDSFFTLNISGLKNNFQAEWNGLRNVVLRHQNVEFFYPFDEPYWIAYGAKIPFSVMKSHLETIVSTIKRDFPKKKLVFIEAYPVVKNSLPNVDELFSDMEKSFEIPEQYDYVGMDCYGGFDNCEGLSIPDYYDILANKMASHQRFILIPGIFGVDSKNNDRNWQQDVIIHSAKYIEYSRLNKRVEAIGFFLFNTPIDKALNIENLIGARQDNSLGQYLDQVAYKNSSLLFATNANRVTPQGLRDPASVEMNPNIHLSYEDRNSMHLNLQTTDQSPLVTISPKNTFDKTGNGKVFYAAGANSFKTEFTVPFISLSPGKTFLFTATPDPGYEFAGWETPRQECGTNSSCSLTMPPADTTIAANFAPPCKTNAQSLVVGETYTCFCNEKDTTDATSSKAIWGSLFYTSDSEICTAAVHLGVLLTGKAGKVTITKCGKVNSFSGTDLGNGVVSTKWDSYEGSFYFKNTWSNGCVSDDPNKK